MDLVLIGEREDKKFVSSFLCNHFMSIKAEQSLRIVDDGNAPSMSGISKSGNQDSPRLFILTKEKKSDNPSSECHSHKNFKVKTPKRRNAFSDMGTDSWSFSTTGPLSSIPGWIQDLRNVWKDEISKMEQSKQEWFQKPQISSSNSKASSKRNSVNEIEGLEEFDDDDSDEKSTYKIDSAGSSLEKISSSTSINSIEDNSSKTHNFLKNLVSLLGGREHDEKLERWRKLAAKIRSDEKDHEKFILKVNGSLKKLKARMNRDLARISKYPSDSLLSTARSYFNNLILRFETKMELEVFKFKRREKILNSITEYLETGNSSALKNVPKEMDGTGIDPKNLPLPDKYIKLEQSIQELDKVISDLKIEYYKLRKEALRPQLAIRTAKLHTIFRAAAKDSCTDSFVGSYYHRWDRPLQNQFNTIICDHRTPEGQAFLSLMKRMHDTNSIFSPEALHREFFDFTKKLIFGFDLDPREKIFEKIDDHNQSLKETNDESICKEDHSDISVLLWPVLKLFVERLIFPSLKQVIKANCRKIDIDKDREFVTKCEWLKKLSQSDLKIPFEMQKKDFNLFKNSSLKNESKRWTKGSSKKLVESSTTESLAYPGAVVQSNEFIGMPYGIAINHLSRLEEETELVPTNILEHCVIFGNLIEEQIREYISGDQFVYCADDLIPVIEWCLVHSGIHNIHFILNHALMFLGKSASTGVGGYYFSSIEIALSHIMGLESENFFRD